MYDPPAPMMASPLVTAQILGHPEEYPDCMAMLDYNRIEMCALYGNVGLNMF